MIKTIKKIFSFSFFFILVSIVFFVVFFLQSYYRFTYEKPVAEIIVSPVLDQKQMSYIQLIEFNQDKKIDRGQFLIKGDQWMLEGDVLQWASWLHLLGFDHYYRLTRLRGRYLKTVDEKKNSLMIYSLVNDEVNSFWLFFYRLGKKVPFIKSVYGSGVFQNADQKKKFLIYIGAQGFAVRQQ